MSTPSPGGAEYTPAWDVDSVAPIVAAILTSAYARGLDPARLALESIAAQRSKVPRILITLLLPVQVILLLIATGISANAAVTLEDNLRTVCLLIATAFTLVSVTQLNPGSNVVRGVARGMRNLAILKTASLLFETMLFAVLSNWKTLFALGVVVVVISLLIFLLAAWAALRVRHYDLEDTEIFYTCHAGNARGTQAEAKEVELKVLASLPEDCDQQDILVVTMRVLEERAKMQLYDESGETKHPEELFRLSDTLAADPNPPADDVATWYAANRVRQSLYDRDWIAQFATIGLLLFLAALTAGNAGYEFYKIFAHQLPLLPDSLLDKYNNMNQFSWYFPARTHNTWKVHMVVVDGLRYDLTEPGTSDIATYFSQLQSSGGAVKFEMRAQLPSFSVPNWVSLISGAPPEQTGVTGNLLASETSYDHVFRQAHNYQVHAGMTGTPWWNDLVQTYMPTLDGDGTVSADFTEPTTPTYPKLTADPADWKRLSVALEAARRSTFTYPFGPQGPPQLYNFFLTHFSDVDKQGHEYGIDPKWNTDQSYMRAISNKTQCLQQIVAAIDNQTILVVVSDHGHVQRGGHGGESVELRRVPAFFYTKGTPITKGPLVGFPSSAAPRYGLYENTDLIATICALLGIPTPRESTGIFIEEIVRSNLMPASVVTRHYYDVFMAKYSLVQQMGEFLATGIFGNVTSGGDISSPSIQRLYASNGSLTDAEYADGIRVLMAEYTSQRNLLRDYKLYRNLAFSCILVPPFLFVLWVIIEHFSIASIQAMFGSSVCGRLNRKACLLGFLSVFLHIGLSLAVFLIGYFAVTGYDVWDSTLTHTPSVAVTFLSRTVAAPVILFVLVTRVVQFRAIRWHSADTIRDIKLGRACNHTNVLRWIGNAFMDILVFALGTSRYNVERFAEAYLYLYYLAMWCAIAAFVELFLCFPFTFIMPVIFATNFVDGTSAVMRFRVCTMLMMITPMLIGSALLLALIPPLDQSTLQQWDAAMLALQIDSDREELEEKAKELENSGTDAEREEIRQRLALMERTTALLQLKTLSYRPDALILAKMAAVRPATDLPLLKVRVGSMDVSRE